MSSDHGLSPIRRKAIHWTNISVLLIESLGTNSKEIVKSKFIPLYSRKPIWKSHMQNINHFVSTSMCLNIKVHKYENRLQLNAFGSNLIF